MKYLPLLNIVHKISDIETVIDIFENFCMYNGIDELDNSGRIKFVLWSNVLPPEDMSFFFDSNTTEHRNLFNLKLFLRNSYTRNREKLMREFLQKIRELEAELAELDRKHAFRIAAREATRNRADAIPNYDVTNIAHKNQSRPTSVVIETASRSAAEKPDENQRSEQPRPASTVSAIEASTPATSANGPSHFSQHRNGQSQRSGQPQPASPGPASTVSAAEASTFTSANDPSHLSQHYIGQSQRSAQPQPAPEQLEPTASSEISSVKPTNARKLSSFTTGSAAATLETSSVKRTEIILVYDRKQSSDVKKRRN